MRRLAPLLLLGSAISVIPGSQEAHASQCLWQRPNLMRFVNYDHVVTGTVLDKDPFRWVIFVDTILKGWRLEAGSTVELRIIRGFLLPFGDKRLKGERLTIPIHTTWRSGWRLGRGVKAATDTCAPLLRDLVDPSSYGLAVLDSIYEGRPHSAGPRPPGRKH